MSGQLNLRLDKWLEGDSLEQGVVANVYAVPSAGERAIPARDRRDLLIPSGAGDPHVVNVEPGRYLVEALLASGDIISNEVTVGEAEQLDVGPLYALEIVDDPVAVVLGWKTVSTRNPVSAEEAGRAWKPHSVRVGLAA